MQKHRWELTLEIFSKDVGKSWRGAPKLRVNHGRLLAKKRNAFVKSNVVAII